MIRTWRVFRIAVHTKILFVYTLADAPLVFDIHFIYKYDTPLVLLPILFLYPTEIMTY